MDSTRIDGYFDIRRLDLNVVSHYNNAWELSSSQLYPSDVINIVIENTTTITPQKINSTAGPEAIFVTLIRDGHARLFEGYSSHDGMLFFIQTDQYPELMKINRNEPGTFLKTYFNAACAVNQKITYKRYSLETALDAYSRCLGWKEELSTSKVEEKSRVTIWTGPRIGYFSTKPTVTGVQYSSIIPPQAGIGTISGDYEHLSGPIFAFDLQSDFFRYFSFRTGFAFSQRKLISKGNITTSGHYYNWAYEVSDPITFSYTRWEVPFEALFYAQPKWKVTPFFGAGINLIGTSNVKLQKNFTAPRNQFEPSVYSFTMEEVIASIPKNMRIIDSPHLFWSLKAGLSFRLGHNARLETSMRFMQQGDEFYHGNNYHIVGAKNYFEYNIAFYIPLYQPTPLP